MQGLRSVAEGSPRLGAGLAPPGRQRHWQLQQRDAPTMRWQPSLRGDRTTQAVHVMLQVLIVVTQVGQAGVLPPCPRAFHHGLQNPRPSSCCAVEQSFKPHHTAAASH